MICASHSPCTPPQPHHPFPLQIKTTSQKKKNPASSGATAFDYAIPEDERWIISQWSGLHLCKAK